jgi:arylsulfatase A-like enzyme
VARDVSLLDLLPTVLALVDVPPRAELDGTDLLSGAPRVEPLFALCSRATAVVVDGRWKYVEPREYRIERHGAKPELYDLASDPLELAPLDDPERAADLRALVLAWRARFAVRDVGAEARSTGQSDDMRAIGYAGEGDEE